MWLPASSLPPRARVPQPHGYQTVQPCGSARTRTLPKDRVLLLLTPLGVCRPAGSGEEQAFPQWLALAEGACLDVEDARRIAFEQSAINQQEARAKEETKYQQRLSAAQTKGMKPFGRMRWWSTGHTAHCRQGQKSSRECTLPRGNQPGADRRRHPLATRARRSVNQSGQAVSKSDSRSVGLPVFKIYEEPASQTEGACLRYMVNRNRGLFKVCGGPFSPNAGACLGNMVIYDEPESPNEGACLTCMLNRYPHMRGRV